MLDSIASVVLLGLVLVVLVNVARGTLGAWVRAKFLGIAPAK